MNILGKVFYVVAVLLGTVIVFAGLLNLAAHFVIYHPRPYPANYRRILASDVVELPFKIAAGDQTCFYRAPSNHATIPNDLWIVFCGNGSFALDWLPLLRQTSAPGTGFLLIDYPGYGRSAGWPDRANTLAAADGAFQALAAHLGVPSSTLEPKINLLGHSLGCAAALEFALHHNSIGRIILLAPFTSLREEGAHFLGPFSQLLLPNYDNRLALRHLSERRPPPRVFIFHGLLDRMIPPALGRDLAAEFPTFVSFEAMPDATHDTIASEAEVKVLTLIARRTTH